MKILQVINALTWGGAQTLLLDLCGFLQSHGHRVTVAAFRDGPLGNRFREAGIPVLILEERLFDVVAYAQLCRWIHANQPDLIHTHLFRASFWARLAARRTGNVPVMTSVHGMESAHFHGVEKHTAHWSRLLVFPSLHLQSWYERSIRSLPASRATVIAPGAPIGQPPSSRTPGRPPRIGTLSRLHPVKGLDRLLSALHDLRRQGLSFELHIGGDGKDRTRLESICRELSLTEVVRFVGQVQNVPEFLSGLDLFCAPSREEAFGINVCEAMERGVATVAADVGGFREVIESGVSGILLPSERPETWTEALRSLLLDDQRRDRLGKAGRERIVQYLNRHDCLQSYLSCIQRLVPGESQPAPIQVAVSSNELGGGERLALALAREFSRGGRDVQALCTGDPLRSAFLSAGIPTQTVSIRAGGLFFGARLFHNAVRQPRRITHTHLNRASLMAGIIDRLLGHPSIAHVHGLNRAVYYRWCRRLIAVSRSVADHLQSQGIAAQRISVLPNAIPPVSTSVASPPEPPPWRIGIVAKLHVNKGHDWALQAIADARNRLPPFQLLIYGDGPERAVLIQRWQNSSLRDCIQFCGFQADMSKQYPSLHVVLLPSLSEGIPLSLLEALSFGIPVIATRIGGIPEIIEHGSNGLLVTPQDASALQEALQTLLDTTTHTRFRQSAHSSFERHNPFQQLVQGVDRLYHELSESGVS